MWTGDTKTPAKRVSDHAKRQREKGLHRVSVWVPASEADRLKAIAASMRERANTPLPSDESLNQDGGRYFSI